jgi:hypothetical protein
VRNVNVGAPRACCRALVKDGLQGGRSAETHEWLLTANRSLPALLLAVVAVLGWVADVRNRLVRGFMVKKIEAA